MNKTKQALSTVIVILLASGPALVQSASPTRAIQEKERTALFPETSMLEMGKTVAGTACAKCHGMDGLSSGQGQPQLAGQRAVYLYRVLKAYKEGLRADEAMQHGSSFLNDEAMLAVSAYYAGLTPERSFEPQTGEAEPLDGNPFLGIQEATSKCTKCHGENGNSTASGMPNLTAQNPEYFVHSMKAYTNGDRNHKLMKKLVSALDDQTIGEMGLFYAVQQPVRTETVGDGDTAVGAKAAEPCAACHGDDGNAHTAEMPTLAGQDARYFTKAMQAYKEGKREHESMFEAAQGLSETEINDLATFYASQEPVRRNVRIPFTTAEWIVRCDRCHGVNGNSTDPRFPMLAGQNEAYLREAMRAYSTAGRPGSVMHAMSEPLSATDTERIVNHYAAQEPKSVVYLQLPCEDTETQ